MDNASRNSVWNEFKLNKAFGSLKRNISRSNGTSVLQKVLLFSLLESFQFCTLTCDDSFGVSLPFLCIYLFIFGLYGTNLFK